MSVVWQACRGWEGATGEGGGQLSECWLKAKCSRSLTSNAVLCGKCKCCKMSVKVSVCVCAYVYMCVWVRVCVCVPMHGHVHQIRASLCRCLSCNYQCKTMPGST